MPAPNSMSVHVHPAMHLADVIEGILNLLTQTLHCRVSMLTRVDGTSVTVVAVNDTLDLVQTGAVYPLEDTFCFHTLREGELSIPDTALAKQAIKACAYARELGIHAFLGMPITLADGQIYGTLGVAEGEARMWTNAQRSTLRLLARLLGHELNLERQERAAERARQFSHSLQSTDELTGLTSAPVFLNQLRTEAYRCIRYGGRYSVAVLELRDYVQIVAKHGQYVADQLLQGLASTLMLNSRIVDCCARLEDGRFAVLFPETPSDNISAWQRRIEAGLRSWSLVHPSFEIEPDFLIGIADNMDAGDDRAVLALAMERMQTQASHAV
jgi:diguanylate cyclase